LFIFLGDLFKRLNGSQVYSVDSFPVEICQIQREKRARLWQDVSLKDYNSSKRRFFYGFKVHMVVTTEREPVFCYISVGSIITFTDNVNLIWTKMIPNGCRAYKKAPTSVQVCIGVTTFATMTPGVVAGGIGTYYWAINNPHKCN